VHDAPQQAVEPAPAGADPEVPLAVLGQASDIWVRGLDLADRSSFQAEQAG
jgi:hypothetical protein